MFIPHRKQTALLLQIYGDTQLHRYEPKHSNLVASVIGLGDVEDPTLSRQ
jgi:hypothetical protein